MDLTTTYVLNDTIRAAYNESRLRIARDVRVFEADGETPWGPFYMQPRLVSGDVSVDGNRDERRTLNSLVLANRDGQLNHNPNGGFWYDKIVKMYRGIYFFQNGVEMRYLCQIGEFMIDSIADERHPHHVTVSGRDYTKKLMLDEFDQDTSFPQGSTIDSIVRIVATNGGIKKFRLNGGDATVGSAAVFAGGSSRWENLKSICTTANIEIYFDAEGYLVTRKFDDVSTGAPYLTLSYAFGKQNIVDFNKSSSDSNIFNKVTVVGTSEEETVTGYAFMSTLENRDANSPTCIQRIGRRTYRTEVNYLTSQVQADDLAKRLLSVKQLEDFQLNFSTVCLPWLEPNRVLEFIDPQNNDNLPTRFLFTDFSIPAGLGPMSGTGKRILIVGSLTAQAQIVEDVGSIIPVSPNDTTAPSIPTGLVASNVVTSSFDLTWAPSTDDLSGVGGYIIQLNGSPYMTSSTNAVTVTGLSPSTTYQVKVASRDLFGNVSAYSTAITVTTTAQPSNASVSIGGTGTLNAGSARVSSAGAASLTGTGTLTATGVVQTAPGNTPYPSNTRYPSTTSFPGA